MSEQEIMMTMQRLRVPKVLRTARLDNFVIGNERQRRLVNDLKGILSKPNSGFGLFGPGGIGKTRLLCSSAAELARNYPKIFECDINGRLKWAHYFYGPQFLSDIQATYRADSEETQEKVRERYGKYRVIFLDDFGKEGITEDFRKHWSFLANTWQEQDTLLYMTSNKSFSEISRLDDSIAWRFEAMMRKNILNLESWERWRGHPPGAHC